MTAMTLRSTHQRRARRRRGPAALLLLPSVATILLAVVPNGRVMSWSPPPQPRRFASSWPTTTSLSSTAETVDETYYGPGTTAAELEIAARNYGGSTATGIPSSGATKITLTRWLSAKVQDYPELRDMESLHLSIQMACKTISNLIHSSTTTATAGATGLEGGGEDTPRDSSMKRLDQISKNVLQNALRFTGRLRVVEAPRTSPGHEDQEGPKTHQPGVTIAYALDQYGKDGSGSSRSIGGAGTKKRKDSVMRRAAKIKDGETDAKWGNTRRLAACFDPLDGSGNADAAICTGTVFGVFDADAGYKGGEAPDLRDASSLSRAVLQPGSKLLAAGYCLYSSTTMLVFTLGGGTHGFTLDQTINEFVLTHPNMKVPKRGSIYSCNEAYSEGWDDKFKGYLKRLKTGKGESGQRYTQRYIGSMVGDVHRTLMYGGIFCCPADSEVHHKGNLQLVYKSAPMAYVLEHAGGRATDGKVDLLSVQPEYVHERSPAFMGSPEDMDELMSSLGDGEDDAE